VKGFLGGTDWSCLPPAANCLPTHNVPSNLTGRMSEDKPYDRLKRAINSPSKENDLRTFFKSKDWKSVFPKLGGGIVSELSKGNLKIIVTRSSANKSIELFMVVPNYVTLETMLAQDAIITMQLTAE